MNESDSSVAALPEHIVGAGPPANVREIVAQRDVKRDRVDVLLVDVAFDVSLRLEHLVRHETRLHRELREHHSRESERFVAVELAA